MTDTTPLKGIPSRHIGGFASPLSRAGSTPTSVGGLGSSPSAGPNRPSPRTLAGRKDGGIKLLDITEQPIGFAQAKKRKRQQGNGFLNPEFYLFSTVSDLNFCLDRTGSSKDGQRDSGDPRKLNPAVIRRGIRIRQRFGNSRKTHTHSRLCCWPYPQQPASNTSCSRHSTGFHAHPDSYTVEGTTSSGSCPSSCSINKFFTSSFSGCSYSGGPARYCPSDGRLTWCYYRTYCLPTGPTCCRCRATRHSHDSRC